MTHFIRNNRGFAVVYGLVVLLLVTAAGTALLYMARKDSGNVADYSKMRSTTQAANAALKACEGQFLNNPTVAKDILIKYASGATEYKYILNSSAATANVKTTYAMGGAGSPVYIAEIKGYDQNKQIVLIEGTGSGTGFGKKKVLAAYKLEGLAMVTPPPATVTIPGGRNALYIAKDGESMNWAATFTGNVYFGGNFIMQSATGPIIINGNLKTGSTTTAASPIQSSLTVNGNAYFQSAVAFQNAASSITGRVGFEKSVTLNANVAIGGDSVYSNSTSSGTGKIVMLSGKTLLHSGTFSSTNLSTGTLKSNAATISNMAERVGVCPGNETPITIDITQIPAAKIKSYATVMGGSGSAVLNATTINNYYTNNSSALWNGYLVIKLGSSDWPQWSATPGTFSKKVIWILDNHSINLSSNTYWYSSETGSGCNTIFYFCNGAQFVPCVWSGNLRGYFYVTGTGGEAIKFYNNNQTLIGGINIRSTGSDPFELTGPTSSTNVFKVTYDEAVIQELFTTGLSTAPSTCTVNPPPGGGGGGGTPVLTLVDKKIRPRLLTQQM